MIIKNSFTEKELNGDYTLTLECENGNKLVFFKTRESWQMTNRGICTFFDKAMVSIDNCIRLFLKDNLVAVIDISDNSEKMIDHIDDLILFIGVRK